MTRRRKLFWFTITAAAASAAMAVVLWWTLGARLARPSDHLRYLPPNALIAIHLDFAALRENALVRQALRSQAPPQWEHDYAGFVQATGFNFEKDLDSVSLGLSGREGARELQAVAAGRFERAKVEQYSRDHRQASVSYRGHAVDLFAGPPDRKFRLAFLGNGRLAFSNAAGPAAIQGMIDLSEQGGRSFQDRLKELNVYEHLPASAQAWVAIDLERAGRLTFPAGWLSPGVNLGSEFLRGSRMALLAAQVGSQDIECGWWPSAPLAPTPSGWLNLSPDCAPCSRRWRLASNPGPGRARTWRAHWGASRSRLRRMRRWYAGPWIAVFSIRF